MATGAIASELGQVDLKSSWIDQVGSGQVDFKSSRRSQVVNPAVITLDSDMESKKKGGMAGQGENEMPKMPPNFVLAPPGMTAPPRAVEWNFPYIPDPKANTGSPAP
ncbi:hypothetical protein M514_08707 [Trichuris suis]|uniref:Uncharacterized protein n=1 Tax=Trichuris suis TaxID=68888 RepID=A0A085MYS2_9BILA|nr:hypothetical protein M514_08707 [Trichuris suis]